MNKFIAETTALGMDVDTEGLFSPDCPNPGDVGDPLDQMIVYRSSDDEEDCTHHQGRNSSTYQFSDLRAPVGVVAVVDADERGSNARVRLDRQVQHIHAGTATRMMQNPRSANASNDTTHIVE
jgi:hypothetical protein